MCSSDLKFSRAVAYRMTPDADAQMTRETAFHPRFSALTRNYTEYRGYWLPARFNNDGPVEEYWACRERAVVMDLSPLRKFEVTGPDAEALMQYCVTRDIRKLSTGQVVYTAMCYENGGMIDDGTVFRGRCDDVVAFVLVHLQDTLDCQVVRLRGAAGEDDFLGIGLDQLGDLLAGVLDRLFSQIGRAHV